MDNKKTQAEIVLGTVTEALPNTMFRVKLDNSPDSEILTYLAGKMRMYKIRILIGDRVEVILDPYGGKGRITRRL